MKNVALIAAAVVGVLLVFNFMSPNGGPIEPDIIATQPMRVGVVSFDNNSGAYAPGWDFGANIATTITTGLGGRSDFRIYERQQLSKVIDEQRLNPLQNPETAVKIGNLTGVQLLIVGKITSANQQEIPTPAGTVAGSMVTVDFKAIDAETGEIKVVDRATDYAVGGKHSSGLHIPTAKRAIRKVGNTVADKLDKYVKVVT